MNGVLVLADGTIYHGKLRGSQGAATGELVFNTSVVGYQEIVTDPSYHRQIVVLTTPEIGNYGTCEDAIESRLGGASGMIVRHESPIAVHRTNQASFHEYLAQSGIPMITEVNTRELVRRIRDCGPTTVWMGPADTDLKDIQTAIQAEPPMTGANLVPDVSTTVSVVHGDGDHRVVLMDYGIKQNTIRHLVKRNCQVIQVPWNTPLDGIMSYQPSGVLLSNGPGDPEAVHGVTEVISQLMTALPVFGICLGYQLMALALGGRTYKLPFGHRGGNHPVKELESGRVVITSQNHGFAVAAASLDRAGVVLTHQSLFDHSLEGFRLPDKPVFGVQFHPEAAPGPRDCAYLFDQFIAHMEAHSAQKG